MSCWRITDNSDRSLIYLVTFARCDIANRYLGKKGRRARAFEAAGDTEGVWRKHPRPCDCESQRDVVCSTSRVYRHNYQLILLIPARRRYRDRKIDGDGTESVE